MALTGTPGTGKTAIADELFRAACAVGDLDIAVLHMNDLVLATPGAVLGRDKERDSLEVDLKAVDRSLKSGWPRGTAKGRYLILEGHLAHLIDVDNVIVLRCHPEVLKARLERRGYAPEKVAENIEAEAIDVITIEAVDRLGKERVCELVTTDLAPPVAAARVISIIKNGFKGPRVGSVDWSDFLMGDGRPNVGPHGAKKARGRGKGGKRGRAMKVKGKTRRRGVNR